MASSGIYLHSISNLLRDCNLFCTIFFSHINVNLVNFSTIDVISFRCQNLRRGCFQKGVPMKLKSHCNGCVAGWTSTPYEKNSTGYKITIAHQTHVNCVPNNRSDAIMSDQPFVIKSKRSNDDEICVRWSSLHVCTFVWDSMGLSFWNRTTFKCSMHSVHR